MGYSFECEIASMVLDTLWKRLIEIMNLCQLDNEVSQLFFCWSIVALGDVAGFHTFDNGVHCVAVEQILK